MPRALLSVSDKSEIVNFAESLVEAGWTILSTGGTAKVLRERGVPVTEVADVTGHPEMMDGRVKTLHPAVHAGLLGRADHPRDREEMTTLGYEPIDLLAVNLYPFRETVSRSDRSDAEVIEQIDIGGPAMLRSAAKNHERVWVVVDPSDYEKVRSALGAPADEQARLRRSLAAKVFAHTSAYDEAIASYLSDGGEGSGRLPRDMTLRLQCIQTLRYGENPDQEAALYGSADRNGGLPGLRQLHGKELSFNNLLDVDGALLAISGWPCEETAACAIIKHTTPCGLAVGATVQEAYQKALSSDPVSAYGSVVAFNRELTEECAAVLSGNFVEAVVAPGFTPGALDVLQVKKNIRLLEVPGDGPDRGLDFKGIDGGFLVQTKLTRAVDRGTWKVVTRRSPTAVERADLEFAWRAVAAVKSNAILIARDGRTLGIGAGQMSRVDASRIAVMKAADNGFDLSGAVLASDAFFPFRDGVDAVANAGVSAIIQPGGSVRDGEVVAAADEHDLAMIFTARRLFRH
ncbi:MAG: bifunctional phosphoribosylaminoimidazolecarboxamide formyltransferase/IMP cyclohydrolase [Gemmatimonas sp.]|nr:bifunctional phosphoribosylaminoimidazolecarboxamide formyltransferase/IMP cyclohydrolase [Gemmatimonas sp.]